MRVGKERNAAMKIREIIRRPAVKRATGYGDTQLDELVRSGELPAPIRLSDGGRARGWFADEIAEYQERRAAAREHEQRAKAQQSVTSSAQRRARRSQK